MKITSKGTLQAKLSRKYEKNGETAIVATIVVLEGNLNGYDIVKNFETTDNNLIQEIAKTPENTKIEVSGYLNCSFYEKDGKKNAWTKIKLTEFKLQESEQNKTEQSQVNNTNVQSNTQQNDNLPF